MVMTSKADEETQQHFSHIDGENEKQYPHSGKIVILLHMAQQPHSWAFTTEKNLGPHNQCTRVHSRFICGSQKLETTKISFNGVMVIKTIYWDMSNGGWILRALNWFKTSQYQKVISLAHTQLSDNVVEKYTYKLYHICQFSHLMIVLKLHEEPDRGDTGTSVTTLAPSCESIIISKLKSYLQYSNINQDNWSSIFLFGVVDEVHRKHKFSVKRHSFRLALLAI